MSVNSVECSCFFARIFVNVRCPIDNDCAEWIWGQAVIDAASMCTLYICTSRKAWHVLTNLYGWHIRHLVLLSGDKLIVTACASSNVCHTDGAMHLPEMHFEVCVMPTLLVNYDGSILGAVLVSKAGWLQLCMYTITLWKVLLWCRGAETSLFWSSRHRCFWSACASPIVACLDRNLCRWWMF